jgi:phosphate/sulfate permease
MGTGGIAVSLIVIAVGAILRFAVYDQNTNGFNVGTIGVILLIVGIIGLIISILVLTMRRRTDVYHHDDAYIDPEPPPRRYYR